MTKLRNCVSDWSLVLRHWSFSTIRRSPRIRPDAPMAFGVELAACTSGTKWHKKRHSKNHPLHMDQSSLTTKPSMPVTWTPFHMHDRDNPNETGLVEINDRVGKIATQMSPGGRIKSAETFRVSADFEKQPLHLTVKALTKIRRNFGIITDRPGKFFIGLGMKQIVHRPAILRARASDSSSGTPLTAPDSISAMRLSVSAFQAAATDGSTPPCRAAMIRSINSATTSPGISRVSSTI